MAEENAADKATQRRGRPRRRRSLSETMADRTSQEELALARAEIQTLTKQKGKVEKQLANKTNKLAEEKRSRSDLQDQFQESRAESEGWVAELHGQAKTLRDENATLIKKLAGFETLAHLTELIDEYRRVRMEQLDINVVMDEIGTYRWTTCLPMKGKHTLTVTYSVFQIDEFISFLEQVIEATHKGMALHERERELYDALTDTDLPGIERVMNFPLPGEPGADAE